MVTLTDVTKIYTRGQDRICALDHVNLDISAGAFCAFVGPSGCGKSTLLNLIAGLDLPMPYAPNLEEKVLPTVERVVAAVRRALYLEKE